MWLKEHYYKVLTRRVSDGCTVFRIVLLPDCEVYRGHFPVVSPCTCTELDVAVRLSSVEDGLEVRARVADGGQVYMEYKGLMTVV